MDREYLRRQLVSCLVRLDRALPLTARGRLEGDYWSLVDIARPAHPGLLSQARDQFAAINRREALHARHDH